MKIFYFLGIVFLISQSYAWKAVLSGGNTDEHNKDVYGKFIELSTPENGSPYIGIITAASEDPVGMGQYYIEVLQGIYNVTNVEWIPIYLNHSEDANNQTMAEKVSTMTGMFFGGGDQTVLVSCLANISGDSLVDSLVLQVIKKNAREGKLAIAGTSAGSDAQQALPMISGGNSWDALAYGAFAYNDPNDPDALTYFPPGGFGFFKNGFLDVHVGVYGREGRMIRLIHDLIGNSTWGVGVDEDTALIINENEEFEIVGSKGAYIFDLEHAISHHKSDFWIDNVKTHYLTKGDRFNTESKRVIFADWKTNIKGKEANKFPMNITHDIFSAQLDANGDIVNPNLFTNVTIDLFNSSLSNVTYGITLQTDPEFIVEFNKTNSRGVIGYDENNNTFVSYENLEVSIYSASSITSIIA